MNDTLSETMEKVKSEMNVEELPDLSKLQLGPDSEYVREGEEEDPEEIMKSFLCAGDEKKDDEDDDLMANVVDKMEQNKHVDTDTDTDSDEMVDID